MVDHLKKRDVTSAMVDECLFLASGHLGSNLGSKEVVVLLSTINKCLVRPSCSQWISEAHVSSRIRAFSIHHLQAGERLSGESRVG